jgi:glycosyltransferase involved in cell wall biosynthesis
MFVAHSFARGGAQKCLYNLATFCQKRGIQCLVIGPKGGPYIDDLVNDGIPVRSLRLASLFADKNTLDNLKQVVKLVLNVGQILRIIFGFRPDVLYTNTSTILAGALAAWFSGTPHIWHIHENFKTFEIKYIIGQRLLARLVKSLAARVIFVSRSALDALFPEETPQNALVIYNGIDTETFKALAHGPYKKPDGPIRGQAKIGYFGGSEYRKGLDVLIKAMSRICLAYPSLSLDIWGNGDHQRERYLTRLCSVLNLSDRIHFKGFNENVARILGDYELVVVPSRAESFCLVALEAMAAAVPVVVTRCGGPEEFVEDGVTGYLADPDNDEALANALSRALSDRSHWSELGRRAQAKACAEFDLQANMESILKVIKEGLQ